MKRNLDPGNCGLMWFSQELLLSCGAVRTCGHLDIADKSHGGLGGYGNCTWPSDNFANYHLSNLYVFGSLPGYPW